MSLAAQSCGTANPGCALSRTLAHPTPCRRFYAAEGLVSAAVIAGSSARNSRALTPAYRVTSSTQHDAHTFLGPINTSALCAQRVHLRCGENRSTVISWPVTLATSAAAAATFSDCGLKLLTLVLAFIVRLPSRIKDTAGRFARNSGLGSLLKKLQKINGGNKYVRFIQSHLGIVKTNDNTFIVAQ